MQTKMPVIIRLFTSQSNTFHLSLSILLILLLSIAINVVPEQHVTAQRIAPSDNHSRYVPTPLTAQQSFSTYKNSTYGIEFMFPSNWNKVETLAGRLINIGFASPRNTSNTTLPVTLDISIEKHLPQNITTVEQYSKITGKLLNATLGAHSHLTVMKLQPTTLSGFSADGRIFNIKPLANIGGPNIWVIQVFTIANNNAYTITYSAEAAKYFDYLSVLKKVLSSFQISPPK
jgi:eukaryotic-like serine/threonine-protein kinase